MDELTILINWSIVVMVTGFFFGIGFGLAWWLWGFGKQNITINFPKKNYFVLKDEGEATND